MPRSKDAKVWNEDLVTALRAREAQCRQQGKARQHLWRDAAIKLEEVRKDIYVFATSGKIVNFPKSLPSQTAEELCRRIIEGKEPIFPPGYVPAMAGAAEPPGGNPYLEDPYLKRMKMKSGSFAILMALHVSSSHRDILTKDEICRIGQPFCDEPMDPNFHQGRAYAGWSSITTLQKHNLVTRHSHVVYRQGVGGLRNQGAHSFSLTNQGKQFIEALLEFHPQVREIIAHVQGTAAADPRPSSEHVPKQEAFRASTAAAAAFATTPTAFASRAAAGGHARVVHRKVTPLQCKDEQALRSWAETARVGQQQTFKGGKERRKHLHNVCDELNETLRVDGRRLHHESLGDAKSRVLFVTVEAVVAMPAAGVRHQVPRTRDYPHSPARKRLEPAFTGGGVLGGGRRLGDDSPGSPTKRSRSSISSIPAVEAAAQAALTRQAIHESKQMSSAQKLHQASSRIVVDSSPAVVDLIDLSENSPEEDRKKKAPPAAARNFRNPYARLEQKFEVPSSTAAAMDVARLERKPDSRKSSFLAALDDSEDDDDDIPPPSCFAAKAVAGDAASGSNVDVLDRDVCILIDSRERDRNATPRAMRMALTQMLSKNGGSLSLLWPRGWKLPTVEEQTLSVGDFAFDLQDSEGRRSRMPVYVERKRVSDLVQRSAKKDHWKQLQKMKNVGAVDGSCIFLIEGDLRTAERFTAYGAQEMEDFSRNNFAIQDQDAAARFLGRAMLTCKCLRFIQTNSEVATYEAIAAVAMVAASATREKAGEKNPPIPNVEVERQKLIQKLQEGGIPREIAVCVADEIGSIEHLHSLYYRVDEEDVRNFLLVPIVEDVARHLESQSSAHSWSTAVHKVFFSGLPDPGAGRRLYDECKHLVEDEARLLCHLHSGLSPDQAVDTVWAEADSQPRGLRRLVRIEIPKALKRLFSWASEAEEAFYRLHSRQPSIRIRGIPVATIQTYSGEYCSDRLLVFVLDGSDLVRRLKNALDSKSNATHVQAARSVAREIYNDCHISDSEDNDRRIILLNGLQPALDQAAKQPGYCLQSRAISYMVLAHIMLIHNMVVLHAVRKTNDCEMMLQQLILACYQFQLLTRKSCEASRKPTPPLLARK